LSTPASIRLPGFASSFTPDGHLVGSLGEVIAAHRYGLTLLPSSSPDHDAIAPDGRWVQVKATQGSQIGIRSACDHLIVLRLRPDGGTDEVYNGPGSPVWAAAGTMQRNGQRTVSTSRLGALMKNVPEAVRLPETAEYSASHEPAAIP
jgi:hypothetical protein